MSMITGTVLNWRIRLQTSNPLMSGSMMSRMTRSGALLLNQGQPLFRMNGRNDPVSEIGQEVFQQLVELFVVVDDEKGLGHFFRPKAKG